MKNKIKAQLLQCIFILTFTVIALSQSNNRLIKAIIAPDHKDWTYKINEQAKFSAQILQYGTLVENVTIDYETGSEALPDVKKEGVVLKNVKTEFTGTMKVPEFYRVRVWAIVDGRRYEGLAKARFEPEKILRCCQFCKKGLRSRVLHLGI